MANGYMPRRDADAMLFMQAFAKNISDQPSAYMLMPSDAATITQAVEEFAQALFNSVNPKTRTTGALVTKDESRVNAEALIAQYYNLIKHNAGILNALKTEIGVRPVNIARRPISGPSTSPALFFQGSTPGVHTLRYEDSMSPGTVAKPFGSAFLELFVAIAEGAVRDVGLAVLCGSYTRNPVTVEHAAVHDGKMATYFARWKSRKGEPGPWSLPISMRIASVGSNPRTVKHPVVVSQDAESASETKQAA